MTSARQTPMVWWITLVIAIAIIWLGNDFGMWWGAMAVGLVIGLGGLGAIPRQRRRGRPSGGYGTVAFCATIAGLLGWLLPLFWRWFHAPVWQASGTISGIMGFGTSAGLAVWFLTALVGLLMSLTACWLGIAIRRLVTG